MRVRFTILVLALLVQSVTIAQQQEDLVAKGLEYLNKRDLVKAEKLFSQALERNPRDKIAHFYLGKVYFKQGKWKEAGDEYREAAKRDFKFKEAWVGYGKALLQRDFTGHNYFAAEQFKKALKVDYYYRDAHLGLFEAYDAMRAYGMAADELKWLIKHGGDDPETYIRLGEIYEKSKILNPEEQNAKVFELYSKAVELAPDRAEAHFKLGWAYFRRQEFQKAIKEYEKGFIIENDRGKESNYQEEICRSGAASRFLVAPLLETTCSFIRSVAKQSPASSAPKLEITSSLRSS